MNSSLSSWILEYNVVHGSCSVGAILRKVGVTVLEFGFPGVGWSLTPLDVFNPLVGLNLLFLGVGQQIVTPTDLLLCRWSLPSTSFVLSKPSGSQYTGYNANWVYQCITPRPVTSRVGAGGRPHVRQQKVRFRRWKKVFEHAIKLKSFHLTQSLLPNEVDHYTALVQA